MSVQLRPENPADDEAFLRRLVMETIALELGADRWPEPMRSHLLNLQYKNRRMGPRAGFPAGESHIILLDGEPAGWIFFANMEHEIHIVEIMVRPEWRSRGVGGDAVRQVCALASAAGKPVRLTVNVLNAGAIRLYERLGFRRVGGDEVQHEMEARP
jgi:ribosomal protein S18 acetylase RimI-like enzyme